MENAYIKSFNLQFAAGNKLWIRLTFLHKQLDKERI